MFRQIIGAAFGSKLASKAPAVGGATGAAIATAIPFVLSRISIPAMLVIGAGGYAAKKYFGKDKDDGSDKKSSSKKSASKKASTKNKPTAPDVPDAPTGTVINPPSGAQSNSSVKTN